MQLIAKAAHTKVDIVCICKYQKKMVLLGLVWLC